MAVPRLGVFGYHPAALPKHRGRHPIIWALALGLRETASTFFIMDDGVDSGDIIAQEFVSIDDEDDAFSLYKKLEAISLKQIKEIVAKLSVGKLERVPQNQNEATYWAKRTKEDGRINWGEPNCVVHNLIRALARPYPGAHFDLGGREIKVWKSALSPINDSSFLPGQIIKLNGADITVKCAMGSVTLKEHELDTLPRVGDRW